jgi:hypothetical protein
VQANPRSSYVLTGLTTPSKTGTGKTAFFATFYATYNCAGATVGEPASMGYETGMVCASECADCQSWATVTLASALAPLVGDAVGY